MEETNCRVVDFTPIAYQKSLAQRVINFIIDYSIYAMLCRLESSKKIFLVILIRLHGLNQILLKNILRIKNSKK